MPIAPTRSEIAPMPPTARLTIERTRSRTPSISFCVVIVKSSSPPCGDEEPPDPFHDPLGREIRREEGVDLEEILAPEEALRRSDRMYAASSMSKPRNCPFGSRTPMTRNRNSPIRIRSPRAVFSPKSSRFSFGRGRREAPPARIAAGRNRPCPTR